MRPVHPIRVAPALALLLLTLLAVSPARAQDHDLEMTDAPDVTAATDGGNWHSPDLKVGADFGDASIPDLIRRGVNNPIYARFYVNGVDDYTLSSGAVTIQLHYRDATVGTTPPALGAPGAGWMPIGSLPVTFAPGEPLLITKTWPTDFSSAGATHLDWSVPSAGDKFHLRAELVYPPGTSDDDSSDNVVVSLYESILGIRDVDLVIVHDVSGSMLTYQHLGSSYLAHAKARAQAFISSMNESHRLAVVAFGGCLTGDVDDVWPTPSATLQPMIWANKVSAVNAVSTGVNVASTGCLTPMGVGIERAVQILTAEAADPTRKRVILVLTDGYENSGTPRACPDSDPAGACLGSSVVSQLQTHDVQVFSIALGAAAWSDCLECLGEESGGEWYATAGPGLDLGEVYLDMQHTYSEDDLYRVDHGVVGRGDNRYATFFEGADDVLYFILQSDDLGAEIDLDLQPPGADWQRAGDVPGARLQRGPGYVVARVAKPATGTWGYRVIGEQGERYLVAVRSDRVGVRLAFDVAAKGVVGSPIRIQAHLTEKGRRIDAEELTARVKVPVDTSLATRLRKLGRTHLLRRQASPLDPDFTEKHADLDPRSAFVHRVSDGQQQRLVKTRTVEVSLEPRRDGSYAGELDARYTRTAGVYEVTVSHRGEKADREYSRSLRLEPARLDPSETFAELVAVKTRTGGRQWRVRVYPTDAFGNALTDRALRGELRVEVRGARPAGKPEIDFDGALVQPLYVEPGQRPVLTGAALGGRRLPLEPTDDGVTR